MSKTVESKQQNIQVQEQYKDVYAYTSQILDLIAKTDITKDEAEWVTRQTVENFRDHVNPGFLGYRKSVTKDGQFAAVEWKDAGPNS
ncbi:putrescine aminotransferase, partial [Mesorhizobium sp. M00.F.Ca.ET.186.01.1.1]